MKLSPVVLTALLAFAFAGCSQPAQSPTPPAADDAALTAQPAQPVGAAMQSDVLPASLTATSTTSSTASRIGVGHIFDNGISTSDILSYKNRYDVVWGSFNPGPWRAGDPSALVSRYYILEEDNSSISGHNLAWWQKNHPDWILYSCTPSGVGTHEIAYTPGVGFADVPLDIHNPNVVAYQQRQSLIPYVLAHGYNAIALDEVVLSNIMLGGNPRLGQSVMSGYFGCGIWQGSKFVRRYSGRSDPAWSADVLAWVKALHSALHADPTIAPHQLSLIINHPGGAVNSTEAALLANTDVDLNETGFSDYGNYVLPNRANYFYSTVRWTTYAQSLGVRVITTDKYTTTSSITTSQIDFSLATYLMANQGRSDLVIAGKTYSVQPYYSQYATSLGTPCAAMYGGASYDSANPHIYYRRFTNGLVVVNSGSLPRASETAHLPANHVYRDVMGRAVKNPLPVSSSDAYTMTTTGSGCT